MSFRAHRHGERVCRVAALHANAMAGGRPLGDRRVCARFLRMGPERHRPQWELAAGFLVCIAPLSVALWHAARARELIVASVLVALTAARLGMPIPKPPHSNGSTKVRLVSGVQIALWLAGCFALS